MTTTESNKLIAEFMGYESYEFRGYTMFVYEENNHRTDTDLHYHASWKWLHNVIDKCFKVAQDGDMVDIMHHLQVSDRDATYKAVIEFINDYNNRKDEMLDM